jgi:shikimate kinase
VKRHLILVGLPGSGKSALGQVAVQRWPAEFAGYTDLDDVIVAQAGRPIAEIFARAGERGFRQLERAAMQAALERPPHLIAAGAGWIAEPGNLAAARLRHAFLVYLRVDPTTADQRLGSSQDRPLLQVGDRLARLVSLLAARDTWYRQADAEIDGSGDLDAVAGALREVGLRSGLWSTPEPD